MEEILDIREKLIVQWYYLHSFNPFSLERDEPIIENSGMR
jgi:hypothetical protein